MGRPVRIVGMQLRSPRLLLPVLAALALLAPACDGGEDEDGDGGGDAGGSADPESGTWAFSGGPISDDTCMYEDVYVDPPGSFTLTNNGDGTFTIDDSENVFDCTLSGASFTCPSRLTGTVDVGEEFGVPGVEALLSYNVEVSGDFGSDTSLSGRQDVEVTCEGANCADLADLADLTLPCGWAQEFTAATN